MEKKTKMVYDYLNENYDSLKGLSESDALHKLATFAAEKKIHDWFQVDSELQRYEIRVNWFWLVRRLRNNISILRKLQTN